MKYLFYVFSVLLFLSFYLKTNLVEQVVENWI
jgi:hypothetical protein